MMACDFIAYGLTGKFTDEMGFAPHCQAFELALPGHCWSASGLESGANMPCGDDQSDQADDDLDFEDDSYSPISIRAGALTLHRSALQNHVLLSEQATG